MTKKKRVFGIAMVGLLVGVGAGEGGSSASDAVATEAIGLSRGDIEDVPTPAAVAENTTDPGDRPVLPRAYPGSPPLVPHGVTDYVPIERNDNACIDCHDVAEKVEGEPTPIPESHYRDLRNAPSEVREEIAGARWNCTACHVPLTGALPLVGNRFGK